jgi:hypothetical protein
LQVKLVPEGAVTFAANFTLERFYASEFVNLVPASRGGLDRNAGRTSHTREGDVFVHKLGVASVLASLCPLPATLSYSTAHPSPTFSSLSSTHHFILPP